MAWKVGSDDDGKRPLLKANQGEQVFPAFPPWGTRGRDKALFIALPDRRLLSRPIYNNETSGRQSDVAFDVVETQRGQYPNPLPITSGGLEFKSQGGKRVGISHRFPG